MKVYQKLAQTLQAQKNCAALPGGNHPWLAKHEETIQALMDLAPSGSGFDNGTSLDEEKSTSEKFVFHTSYHHMNDNGMYVTWTEHTVTITPSFSGFDLKVSGRDRNQIKEYIAETFHEWLSEEVSDKIQNMHAPKV